MMIPGGRNDALHCLGSGRVNPSRRGPARFADELTDAPHGGVRTAVPGTLATGEAAWKDPRQPRTPRTDYRRRGMSMLRTGRIAALLLAAVSWAAPALAPAEGEVGQAPLEQSQPAARGNWKTAAYYIPNRLLDALDIFKLTGSGGIGTAVDFRFTRIFEVGFTDYDVVRVGLNGRSSPVYQEKLSEGSVTVLGFTSGLATRDPYEIGTTLHFMIGGVELAANARSLLDFVGGFLLLDLEDDDLGKEPPRSR
jgi:hypothetical protein